jgi:hypothetical protein
MLTGSNQHAGTLPERPNETGSSPASKLEIDHIGTVSVAASLSRPGIRAPGPDERLVPVTPHSRLGLRAAVVTGVLISALGVGWVGGWNSYLVDSVSHALTGKTTLTDRLSECKE